MNAIDKMDEYYILCGYGRVGKVVLNELIQRNQNVILIEKSEENSASIEESDSVVVINEDATENNLIAKLAGEKCQSVIISTGNDVTNLFIVLSGNCAPRIHHLHSPVSADRCGLFPIAPPPSSNTLRSFLSYRTGG